MRLLPHDEHHSGDVMHVAHDRVLVAAVQRADVDGLEAAGTGGAQPLAVHLELVAHGAQLARDFEVAH